MQIFVIGDANIIAITSNQTNRIATMKSGDCLGKMHLLTRSDGKNTRWYVRKKEAREFGRPMPHCQDIKYSSRDFFSD